MDAQTKVTSPRRKSKSIPTSANVSQIEDPKRRKERQATAFTNALLEYLNQYTEREQEIATGFGELLFTNAWMVRRTKPESSEVIPFPVVNKHLEGQEG